jgi:hypothetical protein
VFFWPIILYGFPPLFLRNCLSRRRRSTDDQRVLPAENRRKVQRIDFYFGSLPITGDIQPTADQVVVLVRFVNGAMRGLLFQADSDDYLLLQMEPKLTSERPKAKPDFRRIHWGILTKRRLHAHAVSVN